jgi:hypothetical protein
VGSYLLFFAKVAAVLVVPIVFGLYTGSFWVWEGHYAVQPRLTTTGRYVLRAVDTAGGEYLFATAADVRAQLAGDSRAAAPLLRVLADDHDGDGHADELRFAIAFVLRDNATALASLEFLPEVNAVLPGRVEGPREVVMTAAPFFAVASVAAGGSSCGVTAPGAASARACVWAGRVEWRQSEPLQGILTHHYDRVYAPSYLEQHVRDVADVRAVSRFATRYAQRNQSLVFAPSTALPFDAVASSIEEAAGLTPPGNSSTAVFAFRATIPTASVAYSPGAGESIKFAWVQFLSAAIVVNWFMGLITSVMVQQAMVNTIAIFRGR